MIYSSIYKIRWNTETDEVGADEPYVLATASRTGRSRGLYIVFNGSWRDQSWGICRLLA